MLLICALFPASAASQQRREPQQFLSTVGFSHDEILRVNRGDVVVKILKPEKHEVAAVAAVRIQASQEFFIARVRDIQRYKKSEAVLLSRKFSDPPQPEDMTGLTLLLEEIQELAACEPGHCHLKLSGRQMELIQKLDFSAPDIEEQASATMRSFLADYAAAYEVRGNKAMIVYADKSKAIECGAQFAELLDRSSNVFVYAPEFRDYLRGFPDVTLERVERFLYWSRENYGHKLKTITAMTDLVIYHHQGNNPPFLIASKQIYASHYMEASLALTMLFDSTEADPSPSFYLVYVNRSRIDLLRKWYSFLARGKLSDKGRESLRKTVTELKSKVEAEFKAAPERDAGARSLGTRGQNTIPASQCCFAQH